MVIFSRFFIRVSRTIRILLLYLLDQRSMVLKKSFYDVCTAITIPFPTQTLSDHNNRGQDDEQRGRGAFYSPVGGGSRVFYKNGVVGRGCRRSSPRFCPGGAVGRVICFVPPLHSLLSTSPPPLIPPTHACASLLPPPSLSLSLSPPSLSLSLSLPTLPPTPTHVNDNAKKQNKTKQNKTAQEGIQEVH